MKIKLLSPLGVCAFIALASATFSPQQFDRGQENPDQTYPNRPNEGPESDNKSPPQPEESQPLPGRPDEPLPELGGPDGFPRLGGPDGRPFAGSPIRYHSEGVGRPFGPPPPPGSHGSRRASPQGVPGQPRRPHPASGIDELHDRPPPRGHDEWLGPPPPRGPDERYGSILLGGPDEWRGPPPPGSRYAPYSEEADRQVRLPPQRVPYESRSPQQFDPSQANPNQIYPNRPIMSQESDDETLSLPDESQRPALPPVRQDDPLTKLGGTDGSKPVGSPGGRLPAGSHIGHPSEEAARPPPSPLGLRGSRRPSSPGSQGQPGGPELLPYSRDALRGRPSPKGRGNWYELPPPGGRGGPEPEEANRLNQPPPPHGPYKSRSPQQSQASHETPHQVNPNRPNMGPDSDDETLSPHEESQPKASPTVRQDELLPELGGADSPPSKGGTGGRPLPGGPIGYPSEEAGRNPPSPPDPHGSLHPPSRGGQGQPRGHHPPFGRDGRRGSPSPDGAGEWRRRQHPGDLVNWRGPPSPGVAGERRGPQVPGDRDGPQSQEANRPNEAPPPQGPYESRSPQQFQESQENRHQINPNIPNMGQDSDDKAPPQPEGSEPPASLPVRQDVPLQALGEADGSKPVGGPGRRPQLGSLKGPPSDEADIPLGPPPPRPPGSTSKGDTSGSQLPYGSMWYPSKEAGRPTLSPPGPHGSRRPPSRGGQGQPSGPRAPFGRDGRLGRPPPSRPDEWRTPVHPGGQGEQRGPPPPFGPPLPDGRDGAQSEEANRPNELPPPYDPYEPRSPLQLDPSQENAGQVNPNRPNMGLYSDDEALSPSEKSQPPPSPPVRQDETLPEVRIPDGSPTKGGPDGFLPTGERDGSPTKGRLSGFVPNVESDGSPPKCGPGGRPPPGSAIGHSSEEAGRPPTLLPGPHGSLGGQFQPRVPQPPSSRDGGRGRPPPSNPGERRGPPPPGGTDQWRVPLPTGGPDQWQIPPPFDPPPPVGPDQSVSESISCPDFRSSSHLGQRGSFWVLYNYIQASRQFGCDESITYTTHADYTFLDNLVPLLERWQGPVSLSVYCPGDDYIQTLTRIQYLRECSSALVKELVTFHLFFDHEHIPNNISQTPEKIWEESPVDCSAEPDFGEKSTTFKSRKHLLYPVNVARNVAREMAQTHFVLASDIELYPNPGLIQNFLDMFDQNSELQEPNPKLFVLPIFELEANVRALPYDKAELLTMLGKGVAIPFHTYVCRTCHSIPKQNEWIKANMTPGLSVFHASKRQGEYRYWEPIYIGTKLDPKYDERLTWEGKSDKMTQGYVLCVLDYDFHILDNAFLVHRPGIKTESTRISPTMEAQSETIAKYIAPELKLLYGTRPECYL